MDEESSTKFMGSLTKFLQSLCNGYVEFEDGVELIGHIYLSVDAGKTGKKLNYFLNEKVCKNDNSVTFISNSFHAQPEGKAKGQSGKDGEGKKDDEVSETSESVPKSTNAGTVPLRTPMSSRSAPSPNQSRSGVQTGTKRPGSPLSAPTPPSQRRMQSSVKSSVGSPVSKTVPSSPSSSSQDNIPSPSPARKNRSEISQPPSNQSDNASIDNESDIVPSNIMTINPPPDFASFIGSLTSDNQTSRDQRSPPDMKPDTDVTFIKEEFVSEPSSCAQTGSSGQSGRSGDDLYPVMLHQNTSVFPSTSSAYPSATATSQHPGFPGASTSQSDPFNPQDGADPSAMGEEGGLRLSRYTGFFPTRRGGRTLVLNGYHYRLDKNIANRTAWKCKVYGCRSRCITNESNEIVKSTNTQTHNHPVDWSLLQRQFHGVCSEAGGFYPVHPDDPHDQDLDNGGRELFDSGGIVVKTEYLGNDDMDEQF
ncbi:uncharacterized protein LOC143293577 isoform X14 [Babylonia areolata]|uniref:uncharacterized protein LOC143293577 isoform X14 n=1 Tax=Babylonia areolata TaxID=304850 RepID=UPI003FD575C0